LEFLEQEQGKWALHYAAMASNVTRDVITLKGSAAIVSEFLNYSGTFVRLGFWKGFWFHNQSVV
jgi:hypothetical protein